MTVDAANHRPSPCPSTGDLHYWVNRGDGHLECVWCSWALPLVPNPRHWQGHIADLPPRWTL